MLTGGLFPGPERVGRVIVREDLVFDVRRLMLCWPSYI